jgi:GntR family transcriptional regulator
MRIEVDPRAPTPPSEQIADQVRFAVAGGRLTPGDRLPSVRGLAAQAVVNPNTVARAYRELETIGLVTSRQGSGTRVSKNGSPLAKKEKRRILAERVDALLIEARQLGVPIEEVQKLIDDREKLMGHE